MAKALTKAELQSENARLREELIEQREEIGGLRDAMEAAITLLGTGHFEELLDGVKQIFDEAGPREDEKTLIKVIERLTSEAAEVEYATAQAQEWEVAHAELEDALENALEDRRALIARLGITDMQWVAQGGHCAVECGA